MPSPSLAFPLPVTSAAEERQIGDHRGVMIALRCATDTDREWLTELYASTRSDEMAMVPWLDAEKTAFLAQQCSLQHQHFVTYYPSASFDIVLADNEPIGRLYVDRGDPWLIVDIALLPAWRGQGLGAMLIAQTLQQAEESEADVALHVAAHNHRARALYERLGFGVTSVDETHYAMLRPYRAVGI